MILVVGKITEGYRLKSYEDILRRFPLVCDEVALWQERDNTIEQILDQVGKPRAIFLYDPMILPSDFSKVDCPVYTWISDTPTATTKQDKYASAHKVKYEAVLHNFLISADAVMSRFNTKRAVHWPAWSAMEYEYDGTEKDVDFLVSGAVSKEYEMRQRFADALPVGSKSIVALGKLADDFKGNLMRSRHSPHDGGKRTVARYFESSFAKSVIVSPPSDCLKACGFVNGENCWLVDREVTELTSWLKFIAEHKRWQEIADNAHRLVKERHTSDARIKDFLEML